MKFYKYIIFSLIFLLNPYIIFSQIGIGTNNPNGILELKSDTLGFIIPRVISIDNVKSLDGGFPKDGTMVYDNERKQLCIMIDSSWFCISKSNFNINYSEVSNYIKASNTDSLYNFGATFTISDNGKYLAIGSPYESSDATGINGDQNNHNSPGSGAVYVFSRVGCDWIQEAYIKASNSFQGNNFGHKVQFNYDGSILLVSSPLENSNAQGINGNQNNQDAYGAGAVYLFSKSGGMWTQEYYIKSPNSESGDLFGSSLCMSKNGKWIGIGAYGEDSNATGVNGNQNNNEMESSGAVYIYSFDNSALQFHSYIKASNPDVQDNFGTSIALNEEGTYLIVGAPYEASNSAGINGNQFNNSLYRSGAVYFYKRDAGTWNFNSYIKSSQPSAWADFGYSLSISNDGNTFIVGAPIDDNFNGTVYIFKYDNTIYQSGILKAKFPGHSDAFGTSVCINNTGNLILIGAPGERSNARNLNGNQNNNSYPAAGAVYLFYATGNVWVQELFIKSSNNDPVDHFGSCVGFSNDGKKIFVSSPDEDSNAKGINGNQNDNSKTNSGAVYIIE